MGVGEGEKKAVNEIIYPRMNPSCGINQGRLSFTLENLPNWKILEVIAMNWMVMEALVFNKRFCPFECP